LVLSKGAEDTLFASGCLVAPRPASHERSLLAPRCARTKLSLFLSLFPEKKNFISRKEKLRKEKLGRRGGGRSQKNARPQLLGLVAGVHGHNRVVPFHLHHVLGGFIVVGDFWCTVFGFLIVGGLYSVTAMRENDNERATVYTKHRLTLQALVTEA